MQIMPCMPVRKDSSGQESEEDEPLFAHIHMGDLRETIALLERCYNPALHSQQLINYCHRCHHPPFITTYNAFRQRHHPQLPEPTISHLYAQNAFPSLDAVGQKINQKTAQLPDPYIPPIPQKLPELLNRLFEDYGYLPNLERFLLFYPSYLEKHLSVQAHLYSGAQLDSRIAAFLSLCAAAEMGSAYVMARMVKRFLRAGGEVEWIEGKYPYQVKSLLILNRVMARACWQITNDIIESILQDPLFMWSRNQLALCVQTIAFAHQMSTIALATGLLPQDSSSLEYLNLKSILILKQEYDKKDIESEIGPQMAILIPIFKDREEKQAYEGFGREFYQTSIWNLEKRESESYKKKPVIEEEMILDVRKVLRRSYHRQELTEPYMREIGNALTNQEMHCRINQLTSPLLPDFHLFEKRGDTVNSKVDYSEYNYDFMAFPVLHNLTGTTAEKIEALIGESQKMTRANFGSEKLSHTKQFRKAVRFYAQNLCGYTHQECDFKNNVWPFLTMALKFYIRLLTLSPLHITAQVLRATHHESGKIQLFDLGHLAILVASAKMSLELTLTIQAFDI